jgi:hypothetical protein
MTETPVIDLTSYAKKKSHEQFIAKMDASEATAEEWPPLQALKFASTEIELNDADKCIVIWTTPPDENGKCSIQYACAGTSREDTLAMVTHLGKKLIFEWF